MESNFESIYTLVIIGFCVFCFAVVWLTILFLTSYFGTWTKLSKKYKFPVHTNPPNLVKKFQSAQLGISNYNGILTLTFYNEGISFETIYLFSFYHPKFLIPWRDIKLVQKSKSIFTWNRLEIGNPPFAKINVSNKTLDEMMPYLQKKEIDFG